jgi:hypothetical protein
MGCESVDECIRFETVFQLRSSLSGRHKTLAANSSGFRSVRACTNAWLRTTLDLAKMKFERETSLISTREADCQRPRFWLLAVLRAGCDKRSITSCLEGAGTWVEKVILESTATVPAE